MRHLDAPLLLADFPSIQAAFAWLDDTWWADAHPEVLHASGRYPSLDDKSMPAYLYVGFLLHTGFPDDPATAHGGAGFAAGCHAGEDLSLEQLLTRMGHAIDALDDAPGQLGEWTTQGLTTDPARMHAWLVLAARAHIDLHALTLHAGGQTLCTLLLPPHLLPAHARPVSLPATQPQDRTGPHASGHSRITPLDE